MSEVKPFASLSSGLLARKGQAKPAMRPQGFGTFGAQSTGFDDLGWNDMGHDRATPAAALTPMDPEPVAADIVPLHADIDPEMTEAEAPMVLQQREEIERSFEPPAPLLSIKPARPAKAVDAPPAVPMPVYAATLAGPAERAAPGSKARAAFTLRLDADRHLKLRLASAVAHRSAQQLVVEALDAYLAKTPAVAGITLPGAAN